MRTQKLVERQRAWFSTGATLSVDARLRVLHRLQETVRTHEQEICAALQEDLNKSPSESYLCEIGMVLDEIRYMCKKLRGWAAPRPVTTPLAQFPAQSFVMQEPYGVVLILSPWNYPFLLSMQPLVGAIAAGNCVVLKPSDYAPATSAMLQKLVRSCMAPEWGTVVTGGRAQNADLLEQKFNYIFFTGGKTVGRLVLEKAACHLTPVTLELGGKSPTIVEESANIPMAARRIVFGKLLNGGQTCVAPDYILVQEKRKNLLITQLKKQFALQLPGGVQTRDYVRIVNPKHAERLRVLLDGEKILYGGNFHTENGNTWLAPTLVDCGNVAQADGYKPMQEEIFGPVLPIVTYSDLGEAVRFVRQHEKPLALYLFTENHAAEQLVLGQCNFGGGCVNDTIIHLATHAMGFGGVGESGMGSYHGHHSFTTFSHEKGIVKKANWLDLPMRYRAYTPTKDKIIRVFMR